MESLFKSEQGRQEILALYDQKLQELNIDVEAIGVQTSFGATNILVAGNESNPPMIVIHGSNGCAPLAFETYPNLTDKYLVYAVDVLAQPNKSAETRLSMKDTSYGKWINEIINQLQLNNVSLAGFSFGGLIILKTLEFDESKIKQVFLSAPAYIVNGNPLKALFRVFIPMKRYMKTQNIKCINKFLKELFTERDEFAVKYLSKVFTYFNMDFTPVPTIQKTAAQSIKTPITLFAAKEDLFFPGEKMLKRAGKIFPSLKYSQLIENSKHVQSQVQNKMIVEKLLSEV